MTVLTERGLIDRALGFTARVVLLVFTAVDYFTRPPLSSWRVWAAALLAVIAVQGYSGRR